MKNILGFSAGFHDAAISIINWHGDVLFAGHSERYSKEKNDPDISTGLLVDIEQYGYIDTIAYYERPWLKQLRQLYSGQGLEWNKIRLRQIAESQLGFSMVEGARNLVNFNHHLSHAAAGFQTSPFTDATVVVIDAVGEFDTVTIWDARYDKNGFAKYKRLWTRRYPHSIGLFYSAATKQAGLKPMEEEYILMGMSAYGNKVLPKYRDLIVDDEFQIKFKHNLHSGIPFDDDVEAPENIAHSAQYITETLINYVMQRAWEIGDSENLVYMGGVALNCAANSQLAPLFDNIWIMPNPGDAGSSLGAAALALGKRINWTTPYLGHNIPGEYPVAKLLDELLATRIVGVASGRAEFGPRALGNRSLLADPRGDDIKDLVNEIKRRQKFRPFAPVILEEQVDLYFDMPLGWSTSPYMQIVAQCKYPHLFPAIIHADGTSRVQTVPKDSDSGIRQLLERWFVLTGCPMLLNTSLNIRGEPMVNDVHDAQRFEKTYGIKVFF